jgi:putative ABC transport system permease protein
MEELVGDSLTLTANNAAYRGSVEPLTRLGALTTLAAWCVALFAVALLSLLLTLWERDRIHEVGALLSFGIPKKSILAQHLIEAAVVFVAAFLVSVAVALPATTQLGHLIHDTSAARATEAETVAEVPATDPAGLEPQIAAPEFDVRLGPDGIVAAGAAGIAIVGLSVGAAFLVVARRSPKDLLTVLE